MSIVTNNILLTNQSSWATDALTTVAGSVTVDASAPISASNTILTTGSSAWHTTGITGVSTTSYPHLNFGNGFITTTDGSSFNIWGPSFKTKDAKRPRFNQYFKMMLDERYFVGAELSDDQVLLFDEANGEVSIQLKTYVEKIKKWEYNLQMIYQT